MGHGNPELIAARYFIYALTDVLQMFLRFRGAVGYNASPRPLHNNNNNNNNNAGASDMGTINSSDRIAATLYCLGIWFVSGIYV
jgi:hypothetical protein